MNIQRSRTIRRLAILVTALAAAGLLGVLWLRSTRPGDQRIWAALKALKSEYHSREMLRSDSKSWTAIDSHGRDSFETLVLALNDSDEDYRFLAVMGLRRLQDPRAVPWLALLCTTTQPVRLESVLALGDFEHAAKPAIPALMRALSDENDGVATVAAQSLSRIVTIETEPIDALRAALGHAWPTVRISAAVALIEISPVNTPELQARAIEVFRDGLADPAEFVRSHCAGQSLQMRSHREMLVPYLVAALHDEADAVRWLAAEALGIYGPKADAAVPSLMAAMQDNSPDVRVEAAAAIPKILTSIPDDLAAECVSVLIEAMTANPPVRPFAACRTLSQIGTRARRAVTQLQQVADDFRQWSVIRELAKETVGQISKQLN